MKSVTISADDVAVNAGSRIDVSGGGGIFGYQFYPSPSGTLNPLTLTNAAGKPYVYVIVPGVMRPGTGVYLQGGGGIAAGYYSVFCPAVNPDDAKYAFSPGAMILTDITRAGQSYTMGQTKSARVIRVTLGYSTVIGTGIRSVTPTAYSVRNAQDVLQQGYYATHVITAGEAGTIKIVGTSGITASTIEGTLVGSALPGYVGATLDIVAASIFVGQNQHQPGILYLNPRSLAGIDPEELDIGDPSITKRIVVDSGVVLAAHRVTLLG